LSSIRNTNQNYVYTMAHSVMTLLVFLFVFINTTSAEQSRFSKQLSEYYEKSELVYIVYHDKVELYKKSQDPKLIITGDRVLGEDKKGWAILTFIFNEDAAFMKTSHYLVRKGKIQSNSIFYRSSISLEEWKNKYPISPLVQQFPGFVKPKP